MKSDILISQFRWFVLSIVVHCSDYQMFKYLQNYSYFQRFAMFSRYSDNHKNYLYICNIIQYSDIWSPPFRAVLSIESWLTRTLEGVWKTCSPILAIPTHKSYVEDFYVVLVEHLFRKSPKKLWHNKVKEFTFDSCSTRLSIVTTI